MTIAFAVFVFVHGFAHVVGFLTVSGIVTDESMTGDPFLIGRWEAGHPVMWGFALIWLALAAGFVIAGIGLLQDTSWALPVLITTTVVSTVLSLLWVRQAPFGVVANVVVIGALVIPAVADRVLP